MTKEIADRIRKMADRVEKNADEPFGGCFIIFPPGENVEPIEALRLDTRPDVALFWGDIKAKADMAVHELSNQDRMGSAFRR